MSESVSGGRTVGAPGVGVEVYLAAVLRYRWPILGLGLAGAVVGFLLASIRPPMFEARATVVVSRPTASGDAPSVTSQATRAFFTNQGVAAQALTDAGLDRSPYNLTAAAFVRDHLALDDLVPGSMLQVRVRLPDPVLATEICGRLVELAIELSGRVGAEESLAGQEFVKQQLDSSRQKLDELEARLLEFKTHAQVDVQREDVRALLEGRRELVDLDVQLAAERGRLTAAESELVKRAANRSVHPADDASGPERRWPSADIGTNGVDTPVAGRLGRLMDDVYEVLDYEAASSRVRLAALESRRKELIRTIGLSPPTIKRITELYAREMQGARLQAEYDVSAKLYQDLLTKYEQVRIQAGTRSTGIKLIDPAIAAATVSRPLRSLAAVLGGGTGLGAGLLLAFAVEFLRSSRRERMSALLPQ